MAEVFPALFDFGPQAHRFAWSEKPSPAHYPADFSPGDGKCPKANFIPGTLQSVFPVSTELQSLCNDDC
jgi:hypothetical protein